MRRFFQALFSPLARILVPVRRFAWTTRSTFLRGLILEMLSVLDVLAVGLYVQNGALLLTQRAFGGGNYLFGKSVMVVGHAAAAQALVQSQLRGSLFMGLPIVAFAPGALMTNAAPTAASQPARAVLRDYMDAHVLTDAQRFRSVDEMRALCAHVLKEWCEDPKRDTMWSLRGCVTRVLGIVLTGIDVPKTQADRITAIYIRRFAEYSMFAHFAPFMLSLLGTDQSARGEVYIPLKRLGMNALQVDMVLFAGMFSVGTITMKCAENAKKYEIDYGALSQRERMAFVIESIRLWPTVSTAHRIVEEPEQVELGGGHTITVKPGQEIAYPFVSVNRDPTVFDEPERFRLDRSPEQISNILSWSVGKHACPARDISIAVTVLFLDTLQEASGDLRKLDIDNIEL